MGRPAALLLVALMLGGCAEVPVQTAVSTVPADALAFTLSGRIAVKHGEQGFSGGVRWVHNDAEDEISLNSPLGQTVARITGSRGGYRLVTSEGRQFDAPDAEALTRGALGWNLPVRGLIHWVRAKNDPARDAIIDIDGEGRVERVRQDGWDIVYARYRVTDAGRVPGLVTLRREDLEIRLAIDEWQSGPGSQ
ncbi:MAG: outer membrane lipoprotein LolB [Betaproteobacteria bacterium]|nr:outer membrane lipoprotein LolB [Betaproteobacteria bacterium]